MRDSGSHCFLVVGVHPVGVIVNHMIDVVEYDEVSLLAVVLYLLYNHFHVDYLVHYLHRGRCVVSELVQRQLLPAGHLWWFIKRLWHFVSRLEVEEQDLILVREGPDDLFQVHFLRVLHFGLSICAHLRLDKVSAIKKFLNVIFIYACWVENIQQLLVHELNYYLLVKFGWFVFFLTNCWFVRTCPLSLIDWALKACTTLPPALSKLGRVFAFFLLLSLRSLFELVDQDSRWKILENFAVFFLNILNFVKMVDLQFLGNYGLPGKIDQGHWSKHHDNNWVSSVQRANLQPSHSCHKELSWLN